MAQSNLTGVLKKEEFGYRHVQKEDDVKTLGKDGHLQVIYKPSEEAKPAGIMITHLVSTGRK